MRTGICIYWRFKGEHGYRFGYPTHVKGQFYRMGLWNGDTSHGVIVNPWDIEIQ